MLKGPPQTDLLQKVMQYLEHIVSPEELLQTQWSWRLHGSGHCPKMNMSWDFLACVPIAGGFMDTAKPLIQFTEEKQTFQRTSEATAVIWSLKKSFCMAVILGCMWPGEWFIVDMVVRSMGIESKLSHMQEGQELVVAYCSRTLSVGWEELLHDSMGVTGYCEDGALPKILSWASIPCMYWPLCPDLAP